MKDMEKTMLEARGQFEALLAYLSEAADQPHALHEVERDLWDGLLALGRTLLLHFVQQKGVGDVGETLPLDDGQGLWRGAVVDRRYLSVFGEIAIGRTVYGSTAQPQAPLDAQLNLPEWKYSYLLQEWGLGFTTKESYKEAGQTLDQILGLGWAVRSLERLADQASAGVAAFRAALPEPVAEEEGALLVATVDGKGVPLRRGQQTSSKRGKRRPCVSPRGQYPSRSLGRPPPPTAARWPRRLGRRQPQTADDQAPAQRQQEEKAAKRDHLLSQPSSPYAL